MASDEIDGIEVHFERTGHGPPLVLLHGGLSDSRAWRPQLQALADEFTVLAWDAPGCGRSADPPADFGLAGYADCLAALVERQELGSPHVLGLSFGGGLALELYRRHPAVPRSLVLASAYAGWAGSLPAEVVEQRRQQAMEQSVLPPEQVVDQWLPTLFSESVTDAVVQEARAYMVEFRPVGMRTMLTAFADADLRDVLDQVAVPTLLLYGDADQRSPLPVAEALHARIPTSQLVVLPGVGHLSNLEAPDAFTSVVRSFLHSTDE